MESQTPETARPVGRRSLPDKIARDASFGVSDLHRLLVREFGAGSPSIATLRRHSAGGKLRTMLAPSRSPTPKYYWHKIRQFYEGASIQKQQHALRRAVEPGATGSELTQEQIRLAVAAAVAPLARTFQAEIAQVMTQVRDLATVRQTLMLKYDAAAGAALERAISLDAQLKETRRLLELDGHMLRLTAEVARLSERVESMLHR